MTRLFWRVFLTVWAIVVSTIVLTLLVASQLPDPARSATGERPAQRAVALVARELARQLSLNPSQAEAVVARERLLDFTPFFQIYVLDPAGQDILGRSLPAAVAEANAQRLQADGTAAAARPYVVQEGLQGYTVVGHEGLFPVGRELVRPGARGVLFASALLVSAAVSLMLARFIVLPVRRLRLAGQRVAGGDLSTRVAHTVGKRTDDIAKLAHDFDAMTERVDGLLQSQQRLMRDVSHELRSPLARLQALLSIARQKARPGEDEQIDRMERELERLDELIGDILTYSKLETRQDVARHPTDVIDLVQNIIDDASVEGQAACKSLRLSGPPRCVIDLDSGLVQRAVENVVRNALKHTAQGSTVDVRVRDGREDISIVVDDRGPGVPPQLLDEIFEPFFRVGESRSTQSGSGGIGLAIARRSIGLHGGTITAHNRDEGGLRMKITLPRRT